ncbi:hypothetical protein OAK85_00110 [Mariniblastus sp.]|nr:hypothetical protein [bacterium]MDC0283728.1 hypothetical protein [Mariniblastus sp.]MDC3255892.1 hypothetical protein [bacterium]
MITFDNQVDKTVVAADGNHWRIQGMLKFVSVVNVAIGVVVFAVIKNRKIENASELDGGISKSDRRIGSFTAPVLL